MTLLSRHFTVGTVNRFSVSYDANGGSGAPSPQTKSRGEDLKLSTKKPVRSGYVFCGWALKRGEAAAYQPGSFYSEDAPAVLYAVWKPEYACIDEALRTEIPKRVIDSSDD